MNLKIVLPSKVLVDTEVDEVVAEGGEGSFGLLPRHVDYTSVLRQGILSYVDVRNGNWSVAVDEGILVKQGDNVTVAVRNASRSRDLKKLRRLLEEEMRSLDDREKKSRSVLAMLEGGIVKQLHEQRAEEPE